MPLRRVEPAPYRPRGHPGGARFEPL